MRKPTAEDLQRLKWLHPRTQAMIADGIIDFDDAEMVQEAESRNRRDGPETYPSLARNEEGA